MPQLTRDRLDLVLHLAFKNQLESLSQAIHMARTAADHAFWTARESNKPGSVRLEEIAAALKRLQEEMTTVSRINS